MPHTIRRNVRICVEHRVKSSVLFSVLIRSLDQIEILSRVERAITRAHDVFVPPVEASLIRFITRGEIHIGNFCGVATPVVFVSRLQTERTAPSASDAVPIPLGIRIVIRIKIAVFIEHIVVVPILRYHPLEALFVREPLRLFGIVLTIIRNRFLLCELHIRSYFNSLVIRRKQILDLLISTVKNRYSVVHTVTPFAKVRARIPPSLGFVTRS